MVKKMNQVLLWQMIWVGLVAVLVATPIIALLMIVF